MLGIRRAHTPSRWKRIANLDLDAVFAKGIFVDGQKWERALRQQTVSPAKQLTEADSTIQIGLKTKPIAYSLSMFLIYRADCSVRISGDPVKEGRRTIVSKSPEQWMTAR